MELNEITFRGPQPIDGYGPGFFRVAGQVIEGPVLISAQSVQSWAGLEDAAAITALAGQIDVVLLGLGADIFALEPAFRTLIEEAGIGLEPMASPSACRTYNVLLSEGRRVAAALLPVKSP